MVELLRKFYHKFKDHKIIQWACHMYENGFPPGDFMAYLRLKKLMKKKSTNKKIKVVFLCQCKTSWNKLQSVYEKMVSDERFEVIIYAVPEDIQEIDMKIYDYFSGLYGAVVLNTYNNGEWLDLEGINPDYIFYQRPYDQYLPEQYRSEVVSKYAKICHVVYGYQISRTTEHSVLNKRFFRNVYMYFAENKIYYDLNRNRFKKSHKESIRKTLNIGYPSLEKFVKSKVEKEDDRFNVLWTPRWTEDEDCGGSNFITFKDKVLELPAENEDLTLTFRPHPMTFDHFISVGKITQNEVDAYLKHYEADRMVYDHGANYEKTFWCSDVLLTDVSSIIAEYFLTGKPVIYCDTGAVPNALFIEMQKVFYVVKTWDEAKKIVVDLKNGIDPLKEMRNKKIAELMGEDFEHISDRFIDEICKDYNASK